MQINNLFRNLFVNCSNDDISKALTVMAFGCFFINLIATVAERSFWCKGKICNDYETLSKNREICHWIQLGTSIIGSLFSVVAILYLTDKIKNKNISTTDMIDIKTE
ncbi:MAG: hypothetical protein K1000chlam2_00064 [Chlamydiae bacterium]|nr:hypothetical protein [Chlamydiota bacterium]